MRIGFRFYFSSSRKTARLAINKDGHWRRAATGEGKEERPMKAPKANSVTLPTFTIARDERQQKHLSPGVVLSFLAGWNTKFSQEIVSRREPAGTRRIQKRVTVAAGRMTTKESSSKSIKYLKELLSTYIMKAREK